MQINRSGVLRDSLYVLACDRGRTGQHDPACRSDYGVISPASSASFLLVRRPFSHKRSSATDAADLRRREGCAWKRRPDTWPICQAWSGRSARAQPSQEAIESGRVVCAGIHMSDIPNSKYRLLWEERQIVSVAERGSRRSTLQPAAGCCGFDDISFSLSATA
jgi:hypothetical protein